MIDRRVRVLQGPQDSILHVSELRGFPYLVLLGEPGSGKTTVLGIEAAYERVPVVKVRAFLMNGSTRRDDGAALYLDALDEYRTEGHASDKVYGLAALLNTLRPARWRLTCRSEDWRKEADIAPIQQAVAGEEIVVAQLLPLDYNEQVAVLGTLKEEAPQQFIGRAEALGAHGFLENPLSLKLLHKAVSEGGAWPKNRFDLFATAIDRLAYERNDEHKWALRSSHQAIVAAASRACLLLLATGRRAIWRSHDEPPNAAGDARAYLTIQEMGLADTLGEDMLDTSLFRGEGEEFEPIHRTVAEFLAAKALASAVQGNTVLAAYSFRRALAMITGDDLIPPTELRGLYAWFAVHLSILGNNDHAAQLIEADAATILFYGDAGAFPTSARRAILNNLGRNDPYFRAARDGDTVVSALAGSDLAEDFAAVLAMPSHGDHRLVTVFEILSDGPPLEQLRPLLHSIVLDTTRPEWQRIRAADAWLNWPGQTPRALLDALASEPVSTARESLRIHLATKLPASELTVGEIKSLLSDFVQTPEDNTVGRLSGLAYLLSTAPRPEFFEESLKLWMPSGENSSHSIELDHAIDMLLAGSIRGTLDMSGTRLWRWTRNARDGIWSRLHEHSSKAVSEWIDGSVAHEIALFDAIVADPETRDGPWLAGNAYVTVAGRLPSAAIVRHVLGRAEEGAEQSDAVWLLSIAIELARYSDDDVYRQVYERIASRPDHLHLLQRLVSAREGAQNARRLEAETARLEKNSNSKAKNIEVLTPVLGELRQGKGVHHLKWAADQYFSQKGGAGGLERLRERTDEAVLGAILQGWEHLATMGLGDIDAAALGRVEGENKVFHVEWSALAGVERLFEENRSSALDSAPIVVAIAALRSIDLIGDSRVRARIELWALSRLSAQPEEGAASLNAFWCGALDAGATHLHILSRLSRDEVRCAGVATALDILLATRKLMPPEALRGAIRAAAKHIDPRCLLRHAESALAECGVHEVQRRIWSFVAFALDPTSHGERFVREHEVDVAKLYLEDVHESVVDALRPLIADTCAVRESIVVRMLGPQHPPDDEDLNQRGSRGHRVQDVIRAAITALTNDPGTAAGQALAALSEEHALVSWRPSLRHARSLWARMRRESRFRYPTPEQIQAALSGGPPVNALDLHAIVLEELARLGSELRTSANTPWKRYWNLDAGRPQQPLIENECRDHLIERLRDRLKPYKITDSIAEARRKDETRVDILVLSGVGRNLPVEAKRHFNPDVWKAASTQLQGYVDSEGADGFGIYVVFWFGNDVEPTPSRLDGRQGPATALELHDLLKQDLAPDQRLLIGVVVFDVSRPDAKISKPRRKRAAKNAAR